MEGTSEETSEEMRKQLLRGMDMFDIIHHVDRKTKRYLASLLQELEEILGDNPTVFKQVRTLVLNSFNDYTRSVVRFLFGDVEVSRVNKKYASTHNRSNS